MLDSSDLIITHSRNPAPEAGDMVIQINPNAELVTGSGRVSALSRGTIVVAWVAAGSVPSDRLHLDKVEVAEPEESEAVQDALARMREALPALRSIAVLLPRLERRRDLDDGWAGVQGCETPAPGTDRGRAYQVLDHRDGLGQMWARADRSGAGLREDQRQTRDQYTAQRAELAALDAEVLPSVMRAAVALHRYGLTSHRISGLLPGIAGPLVDRWLERLSTADAAALARVEPGSWRGAVSRKLAPAADGRFGREPWWCRATVLLHTADQT
ncbi:hypothetical protein [Streptomyces sp. NPDC056672]|uniref:hypothetical protein n=1 Tax=Streptomyces sp. NPDC056672 TaxID=3345906 RepID=UPI003690EFD7